MQRVIALVSGLLFGGGLALSGMVNPIKVQNFLDLFGNWDPTLIFVMGAALAVTFLGYRLVLSRPHPLYADAFDLPNCYGIDGRLVGGACLFGVGWGLTGFCPGPAIASLVFGLWPSVLFVLAMTAGMLAVHWLRQRAARHAAARADG
jgi:uncharacterized membrane protein YedE/YeeE